MKKVLLFLVIVASLVSACGGEKATHTSGPTKAPEATATPEPEPAKTPEATATPPPNPRPRAVHQMAYDAESDQVILYGGVVSSKGYTVKDVWAYDPGANTWERIKSEPAPGKGDGPMTYDTESDRVILFLGCRFDLSDDPHYDCVPASETWAYDYNTNTWSNMEPAELPHGPLWARMAYDAESDRMILFGGWDPKLADGGAFTETWAYDYNTNTWTKMEPEVSPPGRHSHAMAYDAESDRVILWGGRGPVPIDVSSVWAYDYDTDTWEELESSGAPGPVGNAAMVYHVVADRTILYTGQELWAFDYNTNTWTQLSDSPMPGKLTGHAMVYSDEADRVILFGGGPTYEFFRDKTWTYDLSTDTWTDVTRR